MRTRLTGLRFAFPWWAARTSLLLCCLSPVSVCLRKASVGILRPFVFGCRFCWCSDMRRTRVLYHSVVVLGLSPSAQPVPSPLFAVPPEEQGCLILKRSLPTFPLVHYFWGRAQEILSSHLGSGRSSAGCPRNPTLADGFGPAPPQSWVPTWICPGMGKCDSRCPHPSCCPLPHPTPSSSSRLYLPRASARPRPSFFGLTAPSMGLRPQAGAPAMSQ